MRGVCGLATSELAAALHVGGFLPLRILSWRAASHLRSAMVRVLGESSAQLLAGPATRDAIGRTFLVEGVVQEPLLPPLLSRLGQCGSSRHRNRVKAYYAPV
jgi:hypothetical protein